MVRANSAPQCRVNCQGAPRARPVAKRVAGHHGLQGMAWCKQPWAARRPYQPDGDGPNGAQARYCGRCVRNCRRANIEPGLSARRLPFYPDCRISSGLGWSARVPTLLLIGAKDDVSSPPACRQMVDGARRAQCAGPDRGLSRCLSRFRPRETFRCTRSEGPSDAGLPEKGPWLVPTAQAARADFAKARRGMAGAVT